MKIIIIKKRLVWHWHWHWHRERSTFLSSSVEQQAPITVEEGTHFCGSLAPSAERREVSMAEEDLVEIKFRLYDGSDLGPFQYSAASTMDVLKRRLVSDWPQGTTITPKASTEIKLISSGQVLENDKAVGHCRVPFGDTSGSVVVMHVVVQPSLSKTKTEKKIDDSSKKVVCSCSIL